MNNDINEKFLKPYDPTDTEGRIYKQWEDSGLFNPDVCVEKGYTSPDAESFTVVMPPPNANGSLHAGHALFVSLEDTMTRYNRMRGKKALWIPGADHAGFETQVVYEKKLQKEGRTRFGMDPADLYKEIYDFTIENKAFMENQVRSLGASCDWSRERFTLDPDIVKKVQESFVKMNDDDLVYRGKRTINWCFKHQTSLSDVETEGVEENTPFYYFKYGPFEIGTVRPETKFGDKYVVMHPDDKRYSEYKHGQQIEIEWINGPITTTVIKDEAADMEMGTGVMTITPWHSAVDFEIAQRHNLEVEQVIDWNGKLLPIAGEFEGMKVAVARPLIVEKFKEKGLLVRTDEKYTNVVKKCYKCNTTIEPQIKDQWFVKMEPLAKLALEAADKKELTFIPSNYEKIFRYWMENSMDWNISRQIVWGINIPAWLCVECGESKVTMDTEAPTCPTCNKPMTKDTDTFDTWFSSGQWPLLVTGFPDGDDFKTHYPTQVMETGNDLIFKWIPRMIFFGLYFAKKVPFSTVYLHGLVNDSKGKKMSKSKGNVVNPLDLTAEFGTDALRMALVVGNTPGTDLALSPDKIRGYKKFANKIWNATRFILESTKDFDTESTPGLLPEHAEYIATWKETLSDITKDLDNFRYYMAAEKIYHYFWHTLADVIIESTKTQIAGEDLAAKQSAQYMLYTILTENLKVLHPFMPFVTEEIWSMLPHKKAEFLMVEKWPK